MSLILGIDPGSRITGFGLVLFERGQPKHVDNGTINADADNFPDRIGQIHAGLAEVIAHYRPQEVAIEEVFVNKNVSSALKLGQARGAAIVAATSVNLPVSEYTATNIKSAVVGSGRADKSQVQSMVKMLLGLPEIPLSDAADALAVAICHGNSAHALSRVGALNVRRGRYR